MNKPQPLHPEIPTYKELQERIKELERKLAELQSIHTRHIHSDACGIFGVDDGEKELLRLLHEAKMSSDQAVNNPKIPEGYALAPIIPTEGMLRPNCDMTDVFRNGEIYKAMLSAAPKS